MSANFKSKAMTDSKLHESLNPTVSGSAMQKRIRSIDALRGFDMFWITGGDHLFITLFALTGTPFALKMAEQLDHPAWSGFHFYDLIFPLFLFIMGLTMPLSITKRLDRGDSRAKLYKHILFRSLMLYVMGLVYNGLFNLDFEHLRYTGVLHRFAITYLLASILLMNFKSKGIWIWSISITLVYWLVLLLVPVPGVGAYVLTPEGNLSAWIDQQWLPGSFCCYENGDNEGLLTHIPATVNVLAGILAGKFLLSPVSDKQKITYFLIYSAGLLLLGLLWSLVLPINKYLWTGSYLLVVLSLSLALLALFYWIIDVKGYDRWSFFFVVIGMNSILIYLAKELFDFSIIVSIFTHGFDTGLGHVRELFMSLCTISVQWLLLYFLWKKNIFLKL